MIEIHKYSLPITLSWVIMSTSCLAQISSDNSLPNNSVVDSSVPGIDRIIEGTTTGNNLFHSFSQFSVGNGRTAHFDNNLAIENIFSRVTGNSISNIDGIIKVNGTANLFLLNPNGIIFTENARLDIGGSFIGSTADSIQFSDGREFSAKNPQSQPLLSVNLPTALQFTTNPNPITVKGDGHNQDIDFAIGAVLDIIGEGLEVPTEETLALIGGSLNLEGGNLKAEAGRVELGSIQSEGNVNIEPDNLGWSFNYQQIEQFSDITLNQVASINTTGEIGGDVQLQGQNIYFQDGSAILTNTTGSGNAGDVNINATGLIELSGTSDKNIPLPSGILAETTGQGTGGKITISASDLVVQDGGQISSTTFAQGQGGDLIINVDNINLIGLGQIGLSGLYSNTVGSGNAGNLIVNSQNLRIEDAAAISAGSRSQGKGGNIIITALELVEITGEFELPEFGLVFRSTITSTAEGNGDAGNIIVNTKNLKIQEGGQIQATTFDFDGNGGDITINASDSVELIGKTETGASGLFASSIFGSTGNGGDVNVNTNQLDIKEGAQIRVSNFPSQPSAPPGFGIPGNIAIKANYLNLDGGEITTRANFENGGNINLDISEISILSNQGIISATAGVAEEFGDGGNIDFNSQFIIGSGASEITAEAFKGTGGNINLRAEGLFFTPDMIISASSQLGADGEIDIRIPDTQPIEGLIERQNLEYPQQVAVGCQDADVKEGSLTYTGKGGVPELSTDEFSADTLIDDLRPVPSNTEEKITATIPEEKPATKTVKEAQGWQWKDNNKDTVIFTSNPVEINRQNSSSRESYCRSLSKN